MFFFLSGCKRICLIQGKQNLLQGAQKQLGLGLSFLPYFLALGWETLPGVFKTYLSHITRVHLFIPCTIIFYIFFVIFYHFQILDIF